MLTLTIVAFLATPLQDATPLLRHATKHESTLGPSDPVLEGIGPSKAFRYELEADDSVLFIWAASDQADLVLRVEFESGSGSKPTGPAALLAGKKPVEAFTDDDSGGGTTLALRIQHQGGGTLTITVAAKRSGPATETPLTESPAKPFTVHCFEARETAATRAAAAAGAAAIEESDRLAAAGDLERARTTLSEALTTMLATEGRPSSATIAQTARKIGRSTYRLSELPATKTALSFAHDFRSRTRPENHPSLQVSRTNLALTIKGLGDLHGARALFEQVLAVDSHGRVRGVMTAEEIRAMDLSGVELCVLSACETNVGLRRGGQGIASLQSALHAAGVRTAITSLWKVPDEATRELMTEFYRRLWVLQESKAKALWNAKQKLRAQLDANGEPIYTVRDWAGWVLSGDPGVR